MKNLSPIGAAAVASLIAIAIVYPGMLMGTELPVSTESIAISDLFDINIPLRAYAGAAIASGQLPLWYPNCFGGLPLASIPEAAPYYFPSTVFYALLSPGPATAYSIVFHLMLAGVGAAFLIRHFGGRLAAQILASILMSVGLNLAAHMRQLNILQAEAWIPWAWLALDRLLIHPGRRGIAATGFSFGMLGLAGHPEILHHVVVLLAFWAAIRLAGLRAQWRTPRFWYGRAAAVAGSGLLAVAISLPSLGPILEMYQWTDRAQAVPFAPSLKALVTFVRPMILGDPMKPDLPPNDFFKNVAWEQMFYIGLLPVVIAAGHLVLNRSRRRLSAALLVFAAIALLLAYAPAFDSARWLTHLIPFERSSRFSHRYLWCINLVVLIWASLGLDELLACLAGRFRIFRPAILILFASILLLATTLEIASVTRRLNPAGDASPWLTRPESLSWLRKSGASTDAPGERLATYASLNMLKYGFDRKPGWTPNPAIDVELHRLFVGAHPSLWNAQVVKGYAGMTPKWVALITGSQHTTGLLPQLDAGWDKPLRDFAPMVDRFVKWNGFFGARWLASPVELSSPDLRFFRRIPGRIFNAWLYENRSWPGPAWIAHGIKLFPTDDAVARDMIDASPETGLVRITRDQLPSIQKEEPSSPSADRVGRPDAPDPRHVSIDCELARPGILVLNQTWHPRWRVRIDGVEQPVLRVNVIQCAVRLGAGKHRVAFEYSGGLEKFCIAIALAGLLLACAIYSTALAGGAATGATEGAGSGVVTGRM